jgi:hypothetical protein
MPWYLVFWSNERDTGYPIIDTQLSNILQVFTPDLFMKLGGGQSWPRSHLNISASHVKFMNNICIKILISKTHIKGLYHTLWKTGGRDKCRHACALSNVTMVAFPNSFCHGKLFNLENIYRVHARILCGPLFIK